MFMRKHDFYPGRPPGQTVSEVSKDPVSSYKYAFGCGLVAAITTYGLSEYLLWIYGFIGSIAIGVGYGLVTWLLSSWCRRRRHQIWIWFDRGLIFVYPILIIYWSRKHLVSRVLDALQSLQ